MLSFETLKECVEKGYKSKTAIDSNSAPNSVVVKDRELAAQGLNAMVTKRRMNREAGGMGFKRVREIIVTRNNQMRMLAAQGVRELAQKAAEPNPNGFRGTTGPGDTGDAFAHFHIVDINQNGDGHTSTNAGHRHRVANFVVMAADNHVHTLDPIKLKKVASKDADGFKVIRQLVG